MANSCTLTTSRPTTKGPASSRDARPERTRVLVVTGYELGWRTYAANVSETTADHNDVDAVHLHVVPPRWVRVAGLRPPVRRPLPGLLDAHYRRLRAGSRALGRWLDDNLDLEEFDLVHVTPQFLAPAVLARCKGVPVTVTIDSTVTQAKSQRNRMDVADVRRSFRPTVELEDHIFDEVSGIVCLSRWAASDLSRAHARKSVVIPPNIDINPVEPVSDDEQVTRLLFAGNDWERKGGDRLVAWHQSYLAGSAELHLCGSGVPALAGLAGVIRHGFVDRERILQQLMPRMDAFVLPTRSDMSPFAVAEAVAAGLPVISSNVGGIGELVIQGETGFLIEPDDDAGYVAALRSLVDDPGLRARMRASARRHALSLDHRAQGNGLVDWWQSMCTGPSRGGRPRRSQ